MAFENKTEKLNAEGINESKATFYITINSLEFTNPTEMKPGVFIVLKYLDVNPQQTKKQNSGYEWNEKFEM
jgi:hypothetical protein